MFLGLFYVGEGLGEYLKVLEVVLVRILVYFSVIKLYFGVFYLGKGCYLVIFIF